VSQSTRRPDAAGKGPTRQVPTTAAGSTPPTRTGRRERPSRPLRERSFFERNRSRLVAIVAGAVLLSAAVFVVIGATSKAYGCTVLSTPAPAESVGPSQTPQLGQPQPDMGRSHINPGTFQTYTYCPPASGFHVNVQGLGPISARFYGPDDASEPQGWVHNLEHGGLVVLYSCAGGCPDEATLQKLSDFVNPATFPLSPVCKIPAGITGPVVARFDDMKTRFAALLWDRVLLLDTLDSAQILTFFQQFGDTTEPEPPVQCSQVSPSPSAEPSANPSGASASPSGGSAAPSGSATPSGSAIPSGSANPSTGPSGSPATTGPSPSLSPGPS
jgi:hypothetical protein